MVMHDVFAVVMLGIFAAAPVLTFRSRFGFWRSTRIADLVDGERVKVDGVVEPIGQPLRAPFIDMECVIYNIWREDPPPPDETAYHDLGQDFMLRDQAGDSVLVRAGERFDLRGGRAVRLPPHVDAHIVRAGDLVSVVGFASQVPALDGMGATYREPPRRWILSGSETQSLVIVGRTRQDNR
jgi:hypothetical protein